MVREKAKPTINAPTFQIERLMQWLRTQTPTRITKKLLTKRRKFSRARNAAACIAAPAAGRTIIRRLVLNAPHAASKGVNMKIININGKNIDLSTLSRSELVELKNQINSIGDKLKIQIEELRAQNVSTADDKYMRTRNGIRMFGRYSETVSAEITKRKTDFAIAEKQKRTDPHRITIHKAFMDLARTKLDPTVFNQILSEAKDYADRWNDSLTEKQ